MQLDKTLQNFISPPAEFSPIPFWFWNDELNEKKLGEQILSMKAHKIDAFVIHPRIGLPDSLGYLSDEFMHYVSFAVKTAAQNNMKVVLYDEGMYPSGSANGMVVKNNPKFANKCLIEIKQNAKAVVTAPPLTNKDVLIASIAVKIVDGTLQNSKVINIGDRFCEKDLTDRFFAHYVMTFSDSTIRGIHFGEDDLEPHAPKAADLMNINAVKEFIRCTHERYYEVLKEYFGNTIIAMFTDEPSPEGRFPLKNSLPWTDDFLTHLKKELPAEKLPLLWLKDDKRYADAYRKYENTVNKLMGERFFAPISDWCRKHNIALTGHPGKSNDIGHLKHFQLPCQDVVWRYIEPGNDSALTGAHSTMGKCSSDSARHRGNRRNGNEVLGCCGPKENGWLMNVSDMKWYFNWLFARGVNLIYPHAFFYSVTKPRYDERPPDVGFNSYWWNNYISISTYIKRMCYMLTDCVNVCDTAFLCDAYDLPYIYPKTFFENQREFNYLEKELLETTATVKDEYITIEKQRYKNIVIESSAILGPKTLDILRKFKKAGGKVFTAFKNDEFIYIDSPEKLIYFTDELVSLYPPNKDLRASVIIKDNKKFVILINEGEKRIYGELTVKNAAQIVALCPTSGEISPFINSTLSLNPRESLILYIKSEKEILPLSDWKVDNKSVALTNWLTWDGFSDYCGFLTYETEAELSNFSKVTVHFTEIHEMLALSVNESELIYIMLPPFNADITKYLKKGRNKITARVTNSTAVRFSDSKPVSGIIGNVFLSVERNVL